MPSRPSSFLVNLFALAVMGVALFVMLHQIRPGTIANNAINIAQTATVAESPAVASSQATINASTSPSATATPKAPVKAAVVKASKTKPKTRLPSPAASTTMITPAQTAPPVFEITRIQKPYPTPPQSFDDVNVLTRRALVNILCIPQGGGSLQAISGSGVLIDPRGVILTNAHVAQYVLLSESPEINLACTIRTGSPAKSAWIAEVLYMPPVWVDAHAAEISSSHPAGTGEHDYALLRITGSVDGSPLPASFPSLSFDTREVIGFLGDLVLGAAYPAEFVGSSNTQDNLNAVSSVSSIAQLLTFGTKTVDAISLGGVIEAQAGSSGGAVVNAWNKLIGVITTTSEGDTTAQRTLRAVTMSHINRDIQAQTGSDLTTFLQGDLAAREEEFNTAWLQHLLDMYIKQIKK